MNLTDRWATKFNTEKGVLLPAWCRTCHCFERQSFITVEDTQKVWRCAICGAPSRHPDPEQPIFTLEMIIFRDPNDPGEWPDFNFLYEKRNLT